MGRIETSEFLPLSAAKLLKIFAAMLLVIAVCFSAFAEEETAKPAYSGDELVGTAQNFFHEEDGTRDYGM